MDLATFFIHFLGSSEKLHTISALSPETSVLHFCLKHLAFGFLIPFSQVLLPTMAESSSAQVSQGPHPNGATRSCHLQGSLILFFLPRPLFSSSLLSFPLFHPFYPYLRFLRSLLLRLIPLHRRPSCFHLDHRGHLCHHGSHSRRWSRSLLRR